MVGINSLHCIDTDVCARQYETLIKDLKLDLPTTKIYIESVLPTANIYGEYVSNDAINMFNQKLIVLAEKYNLEYIDLNSLYKDGQELNILYTFDGIHLTPSGYFLWYEKIRELFCLSVANIRIKLQILQHHMPCEKEYFFSAHPTIGLNCGKEKRRI